MNWEKLKIDDVKEHIDCVIDDSNYFAPIEVVRLRSCSATVENRCSYICLRSFNTIICIIDCKTGVCYDVLRYVYGYTASSAQHIAKFVRDYSHYITRLVRVVY